MKDIETKTFSSQEGADRGKGKPYKDKEPHAALPKPKDQKLKDDKK